MKLARKLRKSGPGLTPCWREVVAQVIHVKFMYSMDKYEGNHLIVWLMIILPYTSRKNPSLPPYFVRFVPWNGRSLPPPKKRAQVLEVLGIHIYIYKYAESDAFLDRYTSPNFLGGKFLAPENSDIGKLAVGWQAMGISLPEHLAYGRGSRSVCFFWRISRWSCISRNAPNKKVVSNHSDGCKLYIYPGSPRPNKEWSLGWSMWRIPYYQWAKLGLWTSWVYIISISFTLFAPVSIPFRGHVCSHCVFFEIGPKNSHLWSPDLSCKKTYEFNSSGLDSEEIIFGKMAQKDIPPRKFNSSPLKKGGLEGYLNYCGQVFFRGELLNFGGIFQIDWLL